MKTHLFEPSAARQSPSSTWVGTEWVVDALGCEASSLRDLEQLVELTSQVVADLDLKVVGAPQAHQFPFPGGVTVLFMLSESHLACHTYPEHGLATFNLYCCRERQSWPWSSELIHRLGAKEVVVRHILRGSIGDCVRGNG
jgi:S-adenosylmethionine decarboxylase